LPTENDVVNSPVLRLQKRVWQRLKREICQQIGAPSADLARYERRFRAELKGPVRRCAPGDALVAARSADVIYCGDFHTYPASQTACLEVLQHLAAGPSRVVVLLELALSRHQRHLDAWLRGDIDEVQLLARLDWRNTWGFPWAAYRPLLEFARVNGIELVGVNGPGDGLSSTLGERDDWAACHIARCAAARPRAKMLIVAGDLHMARNHLPAATTDRLADLGLARRSVRLLQNSDDLYWRLAADGAVPPAVRLADDTFCLFNGSPWEKLESYLSWLERDADPTDSALSMAGEIDVTDRVLELARALCRLLGLPREAVGEDLIIHTPDDLTSTVTADHRLLRLVVANDVLHFQQGEQMFLARTDLAHLAEAAAEHLAHNLAGPTTMAGDVAPFLARVHRRSLSFFASRLLVPTRRPAPADGCGRSTRALVTGYVRHQGEILSGSARLVQAAAVDDARSAWQVSLTIGRLLGEQLHAACLTGALTLERAAQILSTPIAADDLGARLAELSQLARSMPTVSAGV